MIKDFKQWNDLKVNINNSLNKRLFFSEREIWFCSVGENIGFEQDGKGENFLRPVLIIKKFNKEVFWGVPLTSNLKQNKYYFQIKIRNKLNSIILSQIRLIDGKRLKYRIGILENNIFTEIKKCLRYFLA